MCNTKGEQLLRRLRQRGLVEGSRSVWGKPAWRAIEPGHEPQALMDASALQRRFLACAHGTPCTGQDLCASWVEQSFSRLGLGVVLGSAAELYNGYCHYDDSVDLKVGMIVATPAHPYSAQGLRHGHVGIYAGDCLVMDSVESGVRTVPLDLWLSAYGLMADPRWGWLGSMGLTS
ncbi:MAG: hypothetical protein J6S63_09540 [Atopobiaceae bacterium]|nr:hypothetical protein [Atopobiaceae bacterium]